MNSKTPDENELNQLTLELREAVKKDKASGLKIPKPPKRGEIMICQYCGKPMPPNGFSKIALVRKREFKWHVHAECFEAAFKMCDRQTSGLLNERTAKK